MSADAPKSVQATRVSWLRAGSVVLLLGPLMLLASLGWLAANLRECGRAWDPAGHLLATLGFVVVGVIGLLLTTNIKGDKGKQLLSSPCPSCGKPDVRHFTDRPVACGTCIAYLRANGLAVSEESIDAVSRGDYTMPAQRYQAFGRIDNHSRTRYNKLAMPAMCACCGSDEICDQRPIFVPRPDTSDPGILGEIIAAAVDDIVRDAGAKRLWSPTGNLSHEPGGYEGVTRYGPYAGMAVPVCSKHTLQAAPDARGAAEGGGGLAFDSYRFYKAFAALNQLDPVVGPGPHQRAG